MRTKKASDAGVSERDRKAGQGSDYRGSYRPMKEFVQPKKNGVPLKDLMNKG